ncbi:MAG: hypothetical protein ACFB02_10950 [Mastigocoleus sp.]
MNIKKTFVFASLLLSTSLISCSKSANSQVPQLEVSESTTITESNSQKSTRKKLNSKISINRKSQLQTISSNSAWKTFQGEGVEIQLPQNYEGGNPKQDYEKIRQKIESTGRTSSSLIRALSRRTSVLFAFDSDGARTGNFTNIIIVKNKIPQGISLENLSDVLADRMSQSGRKLIEKKIISLDNYQAGKIITQKGVAKQLIYVITEGNNSSAVIYTTSANTFQEYLPVFEESINTFKFN